MRLQQKASLLFLISIFLYLALSFGLAFLPVGDNPNLVMLLNTALISIPAFLLPALIFRRNNDMPIYKAPRFSHIMIAAAIGLGCVYMNEALSFLKNAIFYGIEIDSNGTTAETIVDLSVPVMILSLAIVPPISEEFLMRGTLLECWRRSGTVPAMVVTSVLFALLHLAPSGFIIYFAIGMLLALVFIITRNVWLTVTIHFVNNMVSVLGAVYLKYFAGSEEAEAARIAFPASFTSEGFGSMLERFLGSAGSDIAFFIYFSGFAAAILIPMLLLLRSIYRRNRLGMYAPEPSSEAAEGPESGFCEAGGYSGLGAEEYGEAQHDPRVAVLDANGEIVPEKREPSILRDALLWVGLAILLVLNVFSALTEFGVLKL